MTEGAVGAGGTAAGGEEAGALHAGGNEARTVAASAATPDPGVTDAATTDAATTDAATTDAAATAPWGPHRLRDRIIDHLRRTSTDSISGITRILSQDREHPIHRLTVAGYLQALAEAGVLRELDRPPSKLYQLQNPESHWSLHQRVFQALTGRAKNEEERLRFGLAILQTLLGRPIFASELAHGGFHVAPDWPRVVVPDPVRRQYREIFERRALPRLEVPPRDPLYQLPPGDPSLNHPIVLETVRRLVLKTANAEHLVAPSRPAGATQSSLDEVGAVP